MVEASHTNITQPSFSSGIISTELFGRLDFKKLESGLKQCENWMVRPAGGVTFRTGTKYIAETKYADKNISLIPFVYNRSDGLCLEFGDRYIRFFENGNQVMKNGSVYEISTNYSAEEVGRIKYVQDKNKMYLVHPNHAPALLERFGPTDWKLRDLVFNPSVPEVTKVEIEKQTAKKTDTVVLFDNWQYAVSIVDKDGHEGMAKYSNKVSSDIDLLNQNIKISFSVSESDLDKIDYFSVYRIKGGEFFRCYTIKPNTGTTYELTDISFALDETKSPRIKFDAFDNYDYPSAVGYWNQRLLLGGTRNKPNTFWGSCVKFPEDFTTTFVNAADEGFELTFNSGSLDAITDFVTMDDLIVFTEGKIWRVSGTSVNNMSALVESYSGSSGIRPYVSKKSILYIDSSINTVSNFIYSYELNGYSGQNLDVLARDEFDGYTLKDISFRDTPYGLLYSVRSDGTLMCLTYMREENVYAWHKHTTEGYFRNVCSVDRDEHDEVYVCIERDGVMYIELFQKDINAIQDINDSWHLDCAGRYKSGLTKWQMEKELPDTTYYRFAGAKKNEEWYCWEMGWMNAIRGGNSIASKLGYIYTQTPTINSDTMVYVTRQKGGYDFGTYTKNSGDLKKTKKFSEAFKATIPIKLIDGKTYGGQWVGYRRYTSGDIIDKSAPPYDFLYTTIRASGTPIYINKDGEFINVGTTSTYTNDSFTYNGYKYTYSSGGDITVSEGDRFVTKYTEQGAEVGSLAYDTIDGTGGQIIDEMTNDYIIVQGDKYSKVETDVKGLTSISGLDRFNGKTVTILADTNVWRNIEVVDGSITLPMPSYNVLVGLPYEGILEVIPHDGVYSSGNSTVGDNRRIVDGVLSYHKSRGLWYGKDINHLYEIKPYTEQTYSFNIPLESGKMAIKVADGFNLESPFMVVQKNPLPAMIQSITLGTTVNGKN